ncbi:putative metal-dependent hydrolase [Thiovulum sp. ES]|nr:putative metal-dependent hydrolase [Thiovulum sp. ES]
MKFLSYLLNSETPTYGNRNRFEIEKKSSILNGDVANDSSISTTTHIGTHLDMPFHFHQNGQTITDFSADFWFFNQPIFIEIQPKDFLIYDDVIEQLEKINERDSDILIIKTGICHFREEEKFWKENYGFSEKLYDYLISNFPKIRIIGFDSISISSFQNRIEGRKAHKKFLNPEKPILILEDMDLRNVKTLSKIFVSPLRIENSDGIPCTVFGE